MGRHGQLSDTDKLTAIATQAAVMAVERADKTPAPPADSTEAMRRIARSESDAHQNRCVNDGPICGVWDAINEMRESVNIIKMEFAEERGAHKQQSRNLTIIASVFGLLSTLASLAGLAWKIFGR